MSSNKSFSTETSERYARAIYELAKEDNQLEMVEKNFIDLQNVYKNNNDFIYFIKNPTQSFNNQTKLINTLSEKMQFSLIFKKFLLTLIYKRRIFFLDKILNSFLKISAQKRGELNAKLISSKSLSDVEFKNISKDLSKAVGSEINFDYTVDQKLIGGFKIQIGSLMIDTTIKNKLKKYEQTMLEK